MLIETIESRESHASKKEAQLKEISENLRVQGDKLTEDTKEKCKTQLLEIQRREDALSPLERDLRNRESEASRQLSEAHDILADVMTRQAHLDKIEHDQTVKGAELIAEVARVRQETHELLGKINEAKADLAQKTDAFNTHMADAETRLTEDKKKVATLITDAQKNTTQSEYDRAEASRIKGEAIQIQQAAADLEKRGKAELAARKAEVERLEAELNKGQAALSVSYSGFREKERDVEARDATVIASKDFFERKDANLDLRERTVKAREVKVKDLITLHKLEKEAGISEK